MNLLSYFITNEYPGPIIRDIRRASFDVRGGTGLQSRMARKAQTVEGKWLPREVKKEFLAQEVEHGLTPSYIKLEKESPEWERGTKRGRDGQVEREESFRDTIYSSRYGESGLKCPHRRPEGLKWASPVIISEPTRVWTLVEVIREKLACR